jgi:MFS family permease
MVSVLTFCALLWGISATSFAAVQNYSGAFVCRILIGFGGTLFAASGDIADISLEAGFSPLIQVFLSRFYAREKLGTRVAVWLAMAPLG